MKRLLFCLALFTSFLSISQPLTIEAKSAILMDYLSGQILFSYNADAKLPPASLTKIISALVILERGNLDDIVNVGINPERIEPSVLGLKRGDKISLRNLLTAMLVRSANDAAIAAAEYVAGSEKKFVELMNEEARKLGAYNSHFVNCHGLHHPLHYTTAYDIAILTRSALHNPIFASIVATPRVEISWMGKDGKEKKAVLENTNKLLNSYPYATGVKTGFTSQAGRCLSAAARKGNWQLICVVLNSPNPFQDAINLFEYGFNNFNAYILARTDVPLEYIKVQGIPSRIPLFPENDICFVFPKNFKPTIDVKKHLYKTKSPIKKGENIGILKATIGREYQCQTKLLAGANVNPSFSQRISSFAKFLIFFIFLSLFLLRLWEERRNNKPKIFLR
ncbi:D-alanyl-D-alanine carboxypeptidase [bacterium]|nr:D-alanyl-D-alanine carboxypeptidase [bacterium]